MTKQKGGKVFGKGSYGTVFGIPRIPCITEGYEDISNVKEVSKIFNKYEDAYDEYDIVDRLDRLLGDDKDKASNFFVLPLDLCVVNPVELQVNDIYKDDSWSMYNGKKLYDTYFTEDEKGEITIPQQVIYEEADNSLYNIAGNIKDPLDFEDFVRKLFNICKGVQLLQNKGLIHGDLKLDNAVSIDKQFKMIDIGDINSMKTMTEMTNNMPGGFEYYSWPSIVAWLSYFDTRYLEQIQEEDVREHFFNDGRRIMTNVGILYLINLASDYSARNIREYIPRESILSRINAKDISDDIKKLIHQVNIMILDDKLFKYPNMVKTYYSYSSLISALETNPTLPQISKYNEIMSSFDNDEELKVDLLKRVDIYSLGIMIQGSIIRLLFNYKDKLDEDEEQLLINFLDLVIDCCEQRERAADINEITRKWAKILDIREDEDVEAVEERGGAAAGGSDGFNWTVVGGKRKKKSRKLKRKNKVKTIKKKKSITKNKRSSRHKSKKKRSNKSISRKHKSKKN